MYSTVTPIGHAEIAFKASFKLYIGTYIAGSLYIDLYVGGLMHVCHGHYGIVEGRAIFIRVYIMVYLLLSWGIQRVVDNWLKSNFTCSTF